jgi:F-type H+-transporting ATPase subunit delta
MQETRVASRYAKSLLQLAQEQNVLNYLIYDMNLFVQVCEENPAFVRTLKSPVISHDKKLTILKKLFDGKVNPITLSLFEIVTRKNREGYLPDIAKEFQHQYKELKGIVEAQVTTTFALTDEIRARVTNIVSESLGKEVDLKEKIDKNIIGGFVLQVGDKQIDESIKSKLQKLKTKFKDSSFISKY